MKTNGAAAFERPAGIGKPVSAIGFFADNAMGFEKSRVAAQVHLAHIKIQDRTDPDTEELQRRIRHLEDWVDDKLETYALNHPTAPWWRRITGTHLEIMGKVLGEIESFGRFYPVGDPWIPSYVTREPITDDNKKAWVWVEGIERLATPSKLIKFSGFVPNAKRKIGKELDFNLRLKTVMYRLGLFGFKMNADKNLYYTFFAQYKLAKTRRLEAEGVKILPTPKGRFCAHCEQEKTVPKDTFHCPDCGEKMGKKEEPEGVIWAGHLDAMCTRRMMTLFLQHIWLVWRAALGLPVMKPYPLEKMPGEHHTFIDPWGMCNLAEAPVPPVRKIIPEAPPAPRRKKVMAEELL